MERSIQTPTGTGIEFVLRRSAGGATVTGRGGLPWDYHCRKVTLPTSVPLHVTTQGW